MKNSLYPFFLFKIGLKSKSIISWLREIETGIAEKSSWDQRRWTWTGDFKCREVKTGFCRKRWTQTGSSGTLIGWKSGQTTFIPLWDRMEGAWLWTQANRRQNLRLVWRNRKKISQIIKDYFCLSFFLLIILWLWRTQNIVRREHVENNAPRKTRAVGSIIC